MSRLVVTFALMSAVVLAGCGEKDINKDVKPVGKDAPKPTSTGGVKAADQGNTLKAPTPP